MPRAKHQQYAGPGCKSARSRNPGQQTLQAIALPRPVQPGKLRRSDDDGDRNSDRGQRRTPLRDAEKADAFDRREQPREQQQELRFGEAEAIDQPKAQGRRAPAAPGNRRPASSADIREVARQLQHGEGEGRDGSAKMQRHCARRRQPAGCHQHGSRQGERKDSGADELLRQIAGHHPPAAGERTADRVGKRIHRDQRERQRQQCRRGSEPGREYGPHQER